MPFLPKTTITPREERGDDFDPIPAGWYAAVIDNAGVRVKNNKRMLSFAFKVTDGPFAHRIVFNDFYLTDAAKERSMKDVRNIVDDCGLEYDGTDDQLCLEIDALKGREIDLKVGVDEAKNGYKARNRYRDSANAWTKVKRGLGVPPTAGAVPPAPVATSAPSAGATDDIPF